MAELREAEFFCFVRHWISSQKISCPPVRVIVSSFRSRYFFLVAFVAFVALFGDAAQAQGYRGRDFWIAFPRNARVELNRPASITLWIAAEARATGRIEFSNGRSPIAVSVQAGAASSFTVDTSLELSSFARLDSLSAHVTVDHDVSLYVIMHRAGSTDSYMAIPTSELGVEYFIAGYRPMPIREAPFSTQAVAIATEDNTVVSVVLSDSVRSFSDSTAMYPAGRTVSHILQRGQTIRYSSDRIMGAGDLTGSRITATKPIAVVTGHACAQVPFDQNYCDVLLEMEPPARDFGTDFYVPAFAWKRSYIVRVVAASDSTRVTVGDSVTTLLDRGQIWESWVLDEDISIHTTKPVLVIQYATSANTDSPPLADPFMLLVTPSDRFITEATAMTLMAGQWNHFLTIVTHADAVGDVRIDGQPLSDPAQAGKVQLLPATVTQLGQFAPPSATPRRRLRGTLNYLKVTPPGPRYAVLRCEIAPGRHLVTSARGFAAYEYGLGHGVASFDSYGSTCGQNLAH